MKLTGPQFKVVVDAAVDAFPTYLALAQVVRYGLGENLQVIASQSSALSDVGFNLVQWAESQGKLRAMLEAMLRANPGNPRLTAASATLDEAEKRPTTEPVIGEGPRMASPAPAAGPQDTVPLYEALTHLLPAQFDEVVFFLGIPSEFLSSTATPLATRASEVVKHQAQVGASGIETLRQVIARVSGRAL